MASVTRERKTGKEVEYVSVLVEPNWGETQPPPGIAQMRIPQTRIVVAATLAVALGLSSESSWGQEFSIFVDLTSVPAEASPQVVCGISLFRFTDLHPDAYEPGFPHTADYLLTDEEGLLNLWFRFLPLAAYGSTSITIDRAAGTFEGAVQVSVPYDAPVLIESAACALVLNGPPVVPWKESDGSPVVSWSECGLVPKTSFPLDCGAEGSPAQGVAVEQVAFYERRGGIRAWIFGADLFFVGQGPQFPLLFDPFEPITPDIAPEIGPIALPPIIMECPAPPAVCQPKVD